MIKVFVIKIIIFIFLNPTNISKFPLHLCLHKNKKSENEKKNLMLKINNRESNEMNPSGMKADKSHKTLSPTLP